MRSLLPLCSVGLVLALTACSTTEATDDYSSVPLTIWADEERAQAMRTFAEAFARDVNRRVEVIVVDNEELRASFLSAHSTGLGPDLLVGPHDWTGELASAGAIVPVGLEEDDAELFSPGALAAVSYDGRVHGVPYATENLALLRNTDLVPQTPDSLEAMVATGTELVDSGAVDQALSLQVGEEGDAYHIHPFFTSAGGYLFGEDPSGDPDPADLGVAAPESIAAFELLAELGEDGSGVLSRSTDATNATSLFASGAAPFLVSGPWSVAAVQEAGLPFAVDPVPSFAEGDPARPLIGVQSFFVASGASDPDLAEKLARVFLDDPELSVILYEADPRVPALDEALEMLTEQDPNLEAFQRAGEGGLPMPAIPEMEAVWSPFSQASADIIGGAEPAEALAEAERIIIEGFDEQDSGA
ncbi:sugar ABC transporter substrate-binding protein [Nocardiopsis terrae]|uniref:Arabinogalactan oligomer/maltooligosaccharide transport system substrate-binding protein n=1 Tax=Nocardiopsis terrae TaxID=372655 RepID=A0ABR9HKG9_9ACTN|nr:maltose ABC transporter substrate-binding protein [Nocardiopsis terrae]MBE1459360.1 arabinogalactan oligomer/maltooligosaccharide transport system substrate-binding protein [Nocardiopsis terrae]GHC96882.1 sugar ABC transporter substrate-binding protein [Nocardiopsis terrae]